VGKLKRKRPLGRPRHRWEDGIRMYLMEIGWGVCVCVHVRACARVEWIHLAQVKDHWRAVVNVVMNLRVLAPQS
jgi:hypothetical protein